MEWHLSRESKANISQGRHLLTGKFICVSAVCSNMNCLDMICLCMWPHTVRAPPHCEGIKLLNLTFLSCLFFFFSLWGNLILWAIWATHSQATPFLSEVAFVLISEWGKKVKTSQMHLFIPFHSHWGITRIVARFSWGVHAHWLVKEYN